LSIKLVTFDFWSTIFHNEPSLLKKRQQLVSDLCEETGVDEEKRRKVDLAVLHAGKQWDVQWKENNRTLDCEAWLTIVLDQIGVQLSEDIFNEFCIKLQMLLFSGNTKEIPGVRDALHYLKQQVKLSIISDTGIESGVFLRKLLEKENLNYFDYYVFSNEFGRSKPHPRVFNNVLEHFNLQPDEVVHIGDSRRTDVAGAKSAGIHTIRYYGCNNDEDTVYTEADYAIGDYAVLPEIIQKINSGV